MAEAVEQLRSGEGWQRWLGVRRHFHTYSLHNQLLIALQMPEATRVAGFVAWLRLGYAVRKGEVGIYIWAPCRPSRKKMREWREAGADPATEPRVFFRMVKVFDRSQVQPLPDFPGGPVALEPPIAPLAGDGLTVLFEPLREVASSIGVSVVIGEVPAGAGGYYRPEAKQIGLQPISTEISPNQLVKTLIHELAHALVRLDRREDDPALTYAEEEVVVECVAFTVCSGLGFDVGGFSVPYVASWSVGGEIERHAALIDRLARRLEEVTSVDPASAEAEDAGDPPHQSGTLEDAEVVADKREGRASERPPHLAVGEA